MITLSHRYSSDVVTNEQLVFLANQLPQPCEETGRPAYTNQELLPGILLILRSGCRWRDLDHLGGASGSTHWRRLRFWKHSSAFEGLWNDVLGLLLEKQKLNLHLLSIDGTLISSFHFREMTGYSGKHHRTGVKVSLLVESGGIPLHLVLAPGNTHDLALAKPTIASLPPELALFANSICLADKGYDSLSFRRFVRTQGMDPNIPKRSCTKMGEETFPLYYRYDPPLGKKRSVIERTNAWLKSFRRLRFRFDYTIASFEAFLYLAIIVILVRKLIL